MIQTSQTALANGRSKIEDGLLLMVRGFAVTTPDRAHGFIAHRRGFVTILDRKGLGFRVTYFPG